jgi:hypothetical protein
VTSCYTETCVRWCRTEKQLATVLAGAHDDITSHQQEFATATLMHALTVRISTYLSAT